MLASIPARTLNPIRSRRGIPRFSLFGKCSKINIAVIILLGVVFVGNAGGIVQEQMPAVYLSALTVFMTFTVASWLRALSIIFLEKSQ
jgi:hypothetical protein